MYCGHIAARFRFALEASFAADVGSRSLGTTGESEAPGSEQFRFVRRMRACDDLRCGLFGPLIQLERAPIGTGLISIEGRGPRGHDEQEVDLFAS
jgi:hypothetical protein